jgi:site-specific DNA-cytosine methylase
VNRVLQKHGFEIVSLDFDPASGADLIQDIMTWDFASAFPPGHFDIITASPPCTEFSRALSTRKRQLEEAVKVVERTLRIIHYFQPRLWWIENPRHGL